MQKVIEKLIMDKEKAKNDEIVDPTGRSPSMLLKAMDFETQEAAKGTKREATAQKLGLLQQFRATSLDENHLLQIWRYADQAHASYVSQFRLNIAQHHD